VDSSFHVWVNGAEVGFATDSKLPSAFEITGYLGDGANVLAVRVYRWGASAYLEKQDYWHLSGIQRSVRLVAKPPLHLRDWCVQTQLDAAGSGAQVIARAWMSCPADPPVVLPSGAIDYPAAQGWTVAMSLSDPDGRTCVEAIAPVATRSPMYGDVARGLLREEAFSAVASLPVADARLWSPETPHLYTLMFELRDPQGAAVDWEGQRVGIREVDIRDGVVRLNGRRLVVRGVNRHEFHPRRGRTLTPADMREDIIAMKRLNFNAVRTCHYPNDDRWYDLCDELGLAVVDEANLETHGLEALLVRDPAWAAAYLERAMRMVLRDRNHASVLFWSLGNESFNGPHQAAMAAWIREADPTRPVQYESGFPGPAISDILAPMYPELDWVREVLADPAEKRPLIMCEYAYAKGNATGNFREFWDLVWQIPRFQGGFLWDWRDKPLETHLPGDGVRWDYGKRKHEDEHVERMCLSGIVGPDLKEHPGAWEVKMQQAPLFAWASDDDLGKCRVRVQNRYHGLGLDHLRVVWVVHEDGRLIAEGSQPAPECAPGATVILELPLAAPVRAMGCIYWLDVRFLLHHDQPWAARGHEVYAAQFALPWHSTAAAAPAAVSVPPVSLAERDGDLLLGTALGGIVINRANGMVTSLTTGRRELLTRPLVGCFMRAPTDIDHAIGDKGLAAEWRKVGLRRLQSTVEAFTVTRLAEAQVRVRVSSMLRADDSSACIRRETVYLARGSGALDIDEEVTLEARVASFARVGLVAGVRGEFGRLLWYGRGPFENYPDRKEAALVGVYSAVVRDLLTPYIFPQENGLRCDVRWAALIAADGAGLLVQGQPTLHLSALPVRLDDLTAVANLADLRLRDEVSLHCDGFHMGVGGDTGWTVNVHQEYRLPPGRYRYGLRLRPLHAGDDPAALGRELPGEALRLR
jgi:beta-galactosidase